MAINPINNPNLSALTPQGSQVSMPKLNQWQFGQLLNAVVLKAPTSSQPQATLNVQGQIVQTKTDVPLKPGQLLNLQVVIQNNQPALKLLSIMEAASPLQTALRNALPKQDSLAPLLANLQYASKPQAHSARLPRPVQQVIEQFMQQLPRSDRITQPKVIERAVKDSGLFFENKLQQQQRQPTAQGSNSIKTDLKAQLQQLISTLQRSTPTSNNKTSTTTTTPNTATTTTSANPATTAAANPKTVPNPLANNATAATPLANQSAATSIIKEPGQAREQAQTSTTSNTQTTDSKPAPPVKGDVPQAQARSSASIPQQLANTDNAISEILRQTTASLARIQLAQVASMPTEPNQPPSFVLAIPVRHGEGTDIFELHIEKDGHNGSEENNKENGWTVTLSFNLDHLGAMRTRLHVLDKAVTANWWADEPNTLELLNREMEALKLSLQSEGLTVNRLEAHLGPAPTPQKTTTPKQDDPPNILDIEA